VRKGHIVCGHKINREENRPLPIILAEKGGERLIAPQSGEGESELKKGSETWSSDLWEQVESTIFKQSLVPCIL